MQLLSIGIVERLYDTFEVPIMSFIAHLGFINCEVALVQLTYNLTEHPHDWMWYETQRWTLWNFY